MLHSIAGTIKFGEGGLRFVRYGEGTKPMLCFHGYGQGKEYFQSMASALPEYCIYSFDLFFHGQSSWTLDEWPLEKFMWERFIASFLNSEKIDQFALCGYSMGGKFALACLELFPDRIEKIILIAPDGIKTQFWYSLATYPTVFRRFFKWQILNPKLFFYLSNWMQKLGLMDKGIIKFAKSQMNTSENRSRVYHSWVVFRLLSFKMKHLAGLINQHQIRFEMYLGSHDKIITQKNMERLLKFIPNHVLTIVPSGHSALIMNTAKLISNNNSGPNKSKALIY